MSRRLLLVLGTLAVAGPGAAAGQTASVGVAPGAGGTVLGRVCLDLDRDGACAEGEPGIAGARVRFEDGRRAIADATGRFHAADLQARVVRADRSAYGDHAVGVDGLGVVRRFELAPGGVAAIDLPVEGAADALRGAVEGLSPRPPGVEGDRVTWPVSGQAPPGARVSAAGGEARAGDDGRWSIDVPLAAGGNAVAIVIEDGAGGVALWALALRVVRPEGGVLRVYPSRPVWLGSMTVRSAGEGVVVVGRISPGVALEIGGRGVRDASDGRFGAWGARDAGGGVRARAALGEVVAEVALAPATRDRPFVGRALGALELQFGGDAGFLSTGRLAASLSGSWRGFDLEAGADLDDRDRATALASPRDALASSRVTDPWRTWLVTGDRAAAVDANPERGRLWARAEGNGLRLELGDARTGLGGEELGRWDRAIFGGRARQELAIGPARVVAVLAGGRVGADANGLAAGAPCQDVLLATGGSIFYLSHRNLVAGSERVRVEWRDPLSRLAVASRELQRGRDYDLDLVGGRLILARPMATVRPLAALTGGDPFDAAEAWLVADYLRVDAAGGERTQAGAELRADAGPVAIGIRGAREDRPGGDWNMAGANASLDLGRALRASVDVARSDGSLLGAGRLTTLDGGFQYGAARPPGEPGASAVHARIEAEAGPARLAGWWRERGAGYSDGAFDERVGARERGALGQATLGGVGLRLAWVERRGADPRDPDGLERSDVARGWGSASFAVGPVELAAEALRERLTLPTRGAQSAAGLRASWKAARGLRLEASHLQGFARTGEVESRTFTAAGVAIDARELALSVRAGWGPEIGPRLLVAGERGLEDDALYGRLAIDPARTSPFAGDASAVGGRQRVAGGTLFTEERVARDAWGLVAGRVVGASLTPHDGVSLVLSGERGERWLDGASMARTVGALAAAVQAGAVRLDGRGELRTEGRGDQWLAGLGAEWPATERLTLSARAFATDGELRGQRARGGEGWLSGAWRTDALSVLARLGAVRDSRPGVAERDGVLAAAAVTAKLPHRTAVEAGVDVALQQVASVDDDRIAAHARGELAVAGPVDVAVEYARRGSLDGRAIGDLDAVRLEAGLTASGVRVALGYTLVGFRGAGVDPGEETDGRVYLRAVVVR